MVFEQLVVLFNYVSVIGIIFEELILVLYYAILQLSFLLDGFLEDVLSSHEFLTLFLGLLNLLIRNKHLVFL